MTMTVLNPIHPLFPHVSFKNSYRIMEAATIIGVSRWSIYRAIHQGDITTLRLGNRLLVIPGTELRKYIEAHVQDEPWFD